VLADTDSVLDPRPLAEYVNEIGAHLILSKLASDESAELHDPDRLSAAIDSAITLTRAGTAGG
jgi:hypothetical protein